jgi:hypothetical protein
MSVRLRLASWWMPRFMMVRELDTIKARTNASLDTLLAEHTQGPLKEEETPSSSGLEGHRAAMARGHDRRVKALIAMLGQEEAVRVGREVLFQTGLQLGREAKDRLGVRPGRADLLRAAGVMYRILGIEFSIVGTAEGERMEVNRCALSKYYSHETCLLLSAVDEGVVSGLNPRAGMKFEQWITGGCPKCVARISFQEVA